MIQRTENIKSQRTEDKHDKEIYKIRIHKYMFEFIP